MKVAFFVNLYPMFSLTFVRREIAALETLGLAVQRVSLRIQPGLVDPEDKAEAARTYAMLQAGKARFAGLALRGIAAAPARFLRTLRFAVGLARRSRIPLAKMLGYLMEAAALARATRGSEFVRVHFGTNGAVVARLARRLGGPPYVVAYHGPTDFDAPERWDIGGVTAEAAFVTAISSFCVSQVMRWTDPAHWGRIHVVRCGVDDRFLPAAPPPLPAEGARRVCVVARLAPPKGLSLLLDALAMHRDAGGPIHLDIVGDGPMRAALERRARDLRFGERVVFHGAQPSDAVRRIIAGSHALVLASFAEGLPVVAMEAMGLGRPVLSTRIAGVPELVVEGETGWLISAGDVGALAGGLDRVAAIDAAELAAMGGRARAAVLRLHSVDRETATLRDLFRRYR